MVYGCDEEKARIIWVEREKERINVPYALIPFYSPSPDRSGDDDTGDSRDPCRTLCQVSESQVDVRHCCTEGGRRQVQGHRQTAG